MMKNHLSLAALAAGLLLLTGCAAGGDQGGSGETASAASETAASAAGSASSSAEGSTASGSDVAQGEGPLTMTDPWTKATDESMTMTGSFGTLTNTSDEPVHITGVRSETGSHVGLHRMQDDGSGQMSMTEAEDGFTVEPGATFELVPGGEHVMFMGLEEPIEPGEEVTYVLETEDGDELEVTSVAREFAGAQESYAPEEDGQGQDAGHGSHEGHGEH